MTGNLKIIPALGGINVGFMHFDEEITGTVNGDMLRARSTSVEVELAVAGNEMAGPGSAFRTPGRFFLRQKGQLESP